MRGAFFFAAGARRVCCGCAVCLFLLRVCAARFVERCFLLRACTRRVVCCCGWAGQPGGVFIFLLVSFPFILPSWLLPSRLNRLTPRDRGCSWFVAAGARRVFFCCGCAAGSLTHLLPAASEHPLQKGIQGPWRFFFLLRVRELWGGAFIFLLRVRGAFIFLLRVRELTHSLTRCPPPGEHQQQKSTHNKKKTRVPNPKP